MTLRDIVLFVIAGGNDRNCFHLDTGNLLPFGQYIMCRAPDIRRYRLKAEIAAKVPNLIETLR